MAERIELPARQMQVVLTFAVPARPGSDTELGTEILAALSCALPVARWLANVRCFAAARAAVLPPGERPNG